MVRKAVTTEPPAALGFRWPAEWELHEATWLGWPHNTTDWPGKFPSIPWAYAEIVRRLLPGEIVRIIVQDRAHEQRARRVMNLSGIDTAKVEFFRFPSNRGWTRDSGPMFVLREAPPSEVAVVNFHFNAWARYRNWQRDARIHTLTAKALGLRLFHPTIHGVPVVLEGGAIDGNGRGTILATEECLLDQKTQARNPGVSQGEMQLLLREYLGATHVTWLGRGIAGDDTHGHVDDLCRFVRPDTVVLCRETDPTDENYRALEENRERLEGMRLEDDSRPEIIFLPMPEPLFFDGRRLPASYANFYISNAAVLVPTFNDPNDRKALGILQEAFPNRTVVGIHAVDLVWGFGTLHCLTHEQPSPATGRS